MTDTVSTRSNNNEWRMSYWQTDERIIDEWMNESKWMMNGYWWMNERMINGIDEWIMNLFTNEKNMNERNTKMT